MEKQFCLILIFLVFFLNIKGEEKDIEDGPEYITGHFESKLTRLTNSKKILPISVEFKNIGNTSVVVTEKVEHRVYCQALADFSPRVKVRISTGDLDGAKKAIIKPGSSFSIELELYSQLLKLTKFNENLNAELTLRFVVMSDRVNYEVYSKPFKLTDLFEEKWIKEIYLTKNEAKIELEADDKGGIFCLLTNNYVDKKFFITPNLDNTKIKISFTKEDGGNKTIYFNRFKLNDKYLDIKKSDEVTILPKKSFKVKLFVTVQDLLKNVEASDLVIDKTKKIEIEIEYHEHQNGPGFYFLPLKSNLLEIKLPQE